MRTFDAGKDKIGFYYSLPALEEKGLGKISRLPVSIRIVLESVLRNCDGKKVAEKDVETLPAWNAKTPAQEEIPFVVARIVLQDFTGVPLLVDLAAMRTAVATLKKDPKIIEPLVPVDLVVDHSVQVDFFGSPDALRLNDSISNRGARKSRGVVHLIGWPRNENTILSPKLTVSTSGFEGSTRCSGGAFSYDPTAPWPIFTSSCKSASTGRTSISIAFVSAKRTTPCHAVAGSAATMHGKSSWGRCTFSSMNDWWLVSFASANVVPFPGTYGPGLGGIQEDAGAQPRI